MKPESHKERKSLKNVPNIENFTISIENVLILVIVILNLFL